MSICGQLPLIHTRFHTSVFLTCFNACLYRHIMRVCWYSIHSNVYLFNFKSSVLHLHSRPIRRCVFQFLLPQFHRRHVLFHEYQCFPISAHSRYVRSLTLSTRACFYLSTCALTSLSLVSRTIPLSSLSYIPFN